MGRFCVARWVAVAVLCQGLWSTAASAARSYGVRLRTVPPGATVYVESKDSGGVGTTPHRLRLTKGQHKLLFELPGYDLFEQTINVSRADTFTFTLVRSIPKASLRVAAALPEQAPGMVLTINGKAEGGVPTTLTLDPGNYLVAVNKPEHRPWEQWVTLASGEQRVVDVTLEAVAPQVGRLLVTTNLAAHVFVDGVAVGEAPALVEHATVGTHAIEIRAEGRPARSGSVVVEAGKTARLALPFELVEAPRVGSLQLLSAKRGADVYVDGEFRGKAPLTVRDLSAGTHLVAAELAGHRPIEQRVIVQAGNVTALELAFQPTAPQAATVTKPAVSVAKPVAHVAKPTPVAAPAAFEPARADESDDPRRVRGQSSFGAQLVSPRNFTGDVTVGFPYLAEGRLTTGVFSRGLLGLDAGVELRTTGAFTEFDVMAKLRVVRYEALALAAMVSLGGGGGPHHRDTFFLNAGVLASLLFKGILTFTGRIYGNFYTDRHCATSQKSGELAVCSQVANARDRFDGARLMLSGVLEVPITDHLGVLALVEGTPFQKQRAAFRDDYYALMPNSDPRIYGRLGLSFKF